MTDRAYERVVIAYLLLMVLAQGLFATFPTIDLQVSRLFAAGASGFPWSEGIVERINLILRRIGEALALLLFAVWAIGGLTGRLRGATLRAWGYLVLCPAIASGIVNLVLKEHFGRARPAHLAEFGGTAEFTPAWQMADQCARNCSFTSGEVAVAAALAIPILVLIWQRLHAPKRRLIALTLAVGYIAVVALLRIGLGRHFLSDAVFSVLFAAGVALVLYPILQIGTARAGFNPVTMLALVRRAAPTAQTPAEPAPKQLP